MLTKGWDTISIIKQDKINLTLKKNWENIDSNFSYKDENLYLEGIFDSWQIINGGAGRIMRMLLPISFGKVCIDHEEISITGSSAVIEITLSLLATAIKDIHILKTEYKNLAKNRNEMTTDKQGWILPIKFICNNEQLGILNTVILDALCQYLICNPLQFELILAEINFAKNTSPSWALPKKCAYSYLDNGYLCILSVCNDRDISDLPLDIDVSSLPFGINSFYIISAELMLKNLILPGVLSLYQNADISNFQFSNNAFYNNIELRMKEIKSGAIYYTPIVYTNRNVIRIGGDKIHVNYVGDCDMKAGIMMYWNGGVEMNVKLTASGYIEFYLTGQNFSHDEDIPWYLSWLVPIVGLITKIIVSIISDDLIHSIAKISSNIRSDGIDTVTWSKETETVKFVQLIESLVLEY